ncbi:MAG: hypothetical protein WDN75_04925 [Bacteroidota bacterium]
MKKEEERLERLIREKKFNQLTTEEREFVLSMLVPEEEFDAMYKAERLLGMESFRSSLQPAPELLSSLKSKMRKERAGSFKWSDLFRIKIPAYAAVLLIILFTSLGFWLRSPLPPAKAISYSPLIKGDTVFVTKIDTLFIERIVYRPIRLASPPKQVPVLSLPEKQVPVAEGVSMKEKEELNKLLVSGLE